jgi:hypothetical protein
MNRDPYVNSQIVKDFISWINTKEPQSFIHNYQALKPRKDWQCHSVYHAYEAYGWPFSSFDSTQGNIPIKGSSYPQSEQFLTKLSMGIKQAVTEGSEEAALNHCHAIMQWGGVLRRNKMAIQRFKENVPLTQRLCEAQQRLNPSTFCLDGKIDDLFINSGFSKVYSLLIDDFVIYDSRVGAALGLLVRHFCEENNLTAIPEELCFAYADAPVAKGHEQGKNVRNPGMGAYVFPKLNNNTSRYILNNMKANWLIKAIVSSENSSFNQLEVSARMRALEAALFMIGYKVW